MTRSFKFPTCPVISFTSILLILASLFLFLALTLPQRVTEFYDHHSTLPDSLQQYQVYLRDAYHKYNYSRYLKPSEFLAINRPERPINLVLVHKEKMDTSHNKQVKFAFHGEVDEIQK